MKDIFMVRGYVISMKLIVALIAAVSLCSMPTQASPGPSLLLLADNDEYDIIIEKYYLRDYDCEITTCAKAEEAIALINANDYDYAMIDLWLDGQRTALDVIKESQSKNPRIKFWVLSGDWSWTRGSKMLTATMALDGHPYSVKPVVKGYGTPTQGDLRGFADMLELTNMRRKK